MGLRVTTEDRLQIAPRVAAPKTDRVVAAGVSLTLHAIALCLFIFGAVGGRPSKPAKEIAVQVVLEVPSPHPELGEVPTIEDEAKKAKAPLGPKVADGRGADRTDQGAPDAPKATPDRRQTQTSTDWDDGEAIARVTPAPANTLKPHLAPPGPARRKAAAKDDIDAAGYENAVKKQKITCGANAHGPVPAAGKMGTAIVLGAASRRQALAMIQKMQWVSDLRIDENYLGNARVFVHRKDAPPKSWSLLPLSAGLSVKAGDRIEVMGWHVDPTRPCHYVPSLGRRVL